MKLQYFTTLLLERSRLSYCGYLFNNYFAYNTYTSLDFGHISHETMRTKQKIQ